MRLNILIVLKRRFLTSQLKVTTRLKIAARRFVDRAEAFTKFNPAPRIVFNYSFECCDDVIVETFLGEILVLVQAICASLDLWFSGENAR